MKKALVLMKAINSAKTKAEMGAAARAIEDWVGDSLSRHQAINDARVKTKSKPSKALFESLLKECGVAGLDPRKPLWEQTEKARKSWLSNGRTIMAYLYPPHLYPAGPPSEEIEAVLKDGIAHDE